MKGNNTMSNQQNDTYLENTYFEYEQALLDLKAALDKVMESEQLKREKMPEIVKAVSGLTDYMISKI